jgi:hypothetical protein
MTAELYEQMADLPAEASAQAGAEELNAAIRQNLPACRSGHGAGREVLGYGE